MCTQVKFLAIFKLTGLGIPLVGGEREGTPNNLPILYIIAPWTKKHERQLDPGPQAAVVFSVTPLFWNVDSILPPFIHS
jgi:hypothetical protein